MRYQRYRRFRSYQRDRCGDRDQSRATHHLKGLGLDVKAWTRVPLLYGGRPLPEEALWHSCQLTLGIINNVTYTLCGRRKVMRLYTGKNNTLDIGGPTCIRRRSCLVATSWHFTYRLQCTRRLLLLVLVVFFGCIIRPDV